MSQATAYEQYMLELINQDRAENGGLQPLAFNLDLNDAAEGHTSWMLANGVFSHTGANGSDPGTRMTEAGYVFSGTSGWAENIAWATTNATAGMQDEVALLQTDLMNSPPHRANLLNGSYKEIGIGIDAGAYQGQDSAFVTQDFAYAAGASFLTGVAYDDLNRNKAYDVGEGLAHVTVAAVNAATGQSFTTQDNDAGGYQLQLAAGTYHVTFSDGVHQATTVNETIGSQNVEADWVSPALASADPTPTTPTPTAPTPTSPTPAGPPTSPGPAPTTPPAAAGDTDTHDFLGDGRSQALLANADNGDVYVGEVTGGQFSYTQVAQLGAEWKFAGDGDFLGQGHDQFLILNSHNGDLDVGSVANGQTTWTQVGQLGSEWSVQGTGSYLGDGSHDVLLQNADNGDVDVGSIWGGQMHYAQVAQLGAEWKVAGGGDFLGQAHDQVMVVNSRNGDVDVGTVSGGQASWTNVAQLGAEWKMQGAGDYLGDGKSQFLMENANNGDVVVGEIGANGQASYTTVAQLGSEWKFVGASDALGQGHDQFIIQNTINGDIAVGSVVNGQVQYTHVGVLGSEWSFHM